MDMIKYLKSPVKAFVFATSGNVSTGEPVMANNIVELIDKAVNSLSVRGIVRYGDDGGCELIDIKLCRITDHVG